MARYSPNENLLARLESKYKIPRELLTAVMKTESGGDINAVSPVGARGLMQFMPATAKQYGVDTSNPVSSLTGAAKMLSDLNTKYQGDIPKVAAAYNWGQGNVDRRGLENAPQETRSYIDKIMGALNPIGEASASEVPYGQEQPTVQQAQFMSRAEWKAQKQAQAGQTAQSTPFMSRAEWKAQKQAQQPGILERAGQNLPKDIENIGQSVIDIANHPIDTLATLGGLPLGAAANLLPESWTQNIPTEDKENAAQLGRSIIGAVKHPLETFAEKPASTFLNTLGLASGAGSLVKGAVGKSARAAEAADIANVSRQNKLMGPKLKVLQEAQKKGYVVPRSEVAPGFLNNRLEGIAGKAALGQESVLRNQQAVSAQARKAIGIAPDKPITGAVIDKAIKKNYAPYEKVAELETQPSLARGYSINTTPQTNSKALLQELKQARRDSSAYYTTAATQGGNPEIIAKADALAKRSKEIEQIFKDRARSAGKPELVKELVQARKNIAKVYDVDKARNVSTGEIDPVVIGKSLDKAPKKITGELKQIGEFQQAFPKYAKAGEGAQTPGVSKIEATTAVAGGFGGTAVGGAVGGFIGSLLPFVSTPVRNYLLSPGYQAKIVQLAKKNPSKLKAFVSKYSNKTIDERALLGLVASDKQNENKLDRLIK